ncbi:MAG: glycosyltransferase family 4 protein, partial [Planctomycetes bacterium]|nr:glycosyltransferase family 4 protein [Planctomycetota bacterium]
MRLLYVCAGDLSRPFAPTIHVMEVAEELARLGHEIEILALTPAPYPHATPVRVRPIMPLTPLGWGLFGRAILAPVLYREARRFRPHWIYEREIAYTCAPLRIARLTGARHALELNGCPGDELRSGGAPIRAGILEAIQRWNLAGTDLTVAVTEELGHTCVRSRGARTSRTVVVPNGVNTRRFRPEDRDACRRRLGWPLAPGTVLFVGSFYEHHGLHRVVEVIPRVRASFPEVRFVFVGDGPTRGRTEAEARALGVADSCTFTGTVDHSEVPSWINAADLCLHLDVRSSGATGDSGLKLYEYLACGRRTLALTTTRVTLSRPPPGSSLFLRLEASSTPGGPFAEAVIGALRASAPSPAEVEAMHAA